MLINKLKVLYITIVCSTVGGGILFLTYNNNQPSLKMDLNNSLNLPEKIQLSETKLESLYNSYSEKHNRVVAELLSSKTAPNSPLLPGVVVVRPAMKTGYGNRFPALTCGFLYSLITDRLFFIDGYQNFENYFEKDFDHDWNKVVDLYKNSKSRYLHNNNRYNDFALITKGDLNSAKVNSSTILYVQTLDYPCAPLTSNPHYREWFATVIPNYKVYAAISSKLLRLQKSIKKQVENFVTNHFSNYNIGVHVRTKKTMKGMSTPGGHYCQVVRMLLLEKQGQPVSVFIAADTNQSRDDLVNCLRQSLVTVGNNSVKVVYAENNMDTKNPLTNNPGTEINALIDMKLLSLCDDLVITYGSSFGFAAAGWSEKVGSSRGSFVMMPIKNLTDDLTMVDKVWVWGAGSREPCMYLSKALLHNEDVETIKLFKNNPLWLHYSQCHWPINIKKGSKN